jgi:L-asparagine transporter-like permease
MSHHSTLHDRAEHARRREIVRALLLAVIWIPTALLAVALILLAGLDAVHAWVIAWLVWTTILAGGYLAQRRRRRPST